MTWEVVDSKYGYVLVRDEISGKWSVVQEYGDNQVMAVMPGDKTPGSGNAIANFTPKGIGYVTRGYSRSYAYRVYRDLISEAE